MEPITIDAVLYALGALCLLFALAVLTPLGALSLYRRLTGPHGGSALRRILSLVLVALIILSGIAGGAAIEKRIAAENRELGYPAGRQNERERSRRREEQAYLDGFDDGQAAREGSAP